MARTKIATGITEIDVMLPKHGHKPAVCQTVMEVQQVLKDEVLPMIHKGKGSNLNVKFANQEMELVHRDKVDNFVECYNSIAIANSIEQILVTPCISAG